MGAKTWSFVFGLLTGSSLYAVFHWVKSRRLKEKKTCIDSPDDCYFFSPKMFTVKCSNEMSGNCGLLSCPICNYQKFFKQIQSTKSSLDVCVYLITSEELSNLIICLFKQGVFVRIIIDRQMSDEALNSKIHVFLKEHIPIKVINTGEMMHNKFVIIDKKKVITGSFNWTKQGMLYNYENGIVTYNEQIVRKYSMYFQDIWLSKS